MPTLAQLPYELKEAIADCAYGDGLAQLSSVNREWERICTPKIWQNIKLQFGDSDETDEELGFRKATPPEIIRHALPKHCSKQLSQTYGDDSLTRQQEVEIYCCSPTEDDIDLLSAALHFVEPIAVDVRATEADRVSEARDANAPYSCKLLRRLATVLACNVAMTEKLDIVYSVARRDLSTAAEILVSLYRSAEECAFISCHIDWDTPKENAHAVLATILSLPSLIVLDFVCDDLSGFSPDDPACQLISLHFDARQMNEVNVQENAEAVHRILKQRNTTLNSLWLYNAFPRHATGSHKLPFPALSEVNIAATTKTPAIFAFFDGSQCPLLKSINFYRNERVLLDALEDFVDTLPLRASLSIELPAFDARWNNRRVRKELLALCERQKVRIRVREDQEG